MQVSDYVQKKYGITRLPREMMLEGSISEMNIADLIAVIIGRGTKKESVFALSERIIKEYGSKAVAEIKDPHKINTILGIGKVNSCKLVAAFELGRRFYSPEVKKRPIVRGPEDVFSYVSDMTGLTKEHFRGIYLNSKNYIIHDEIISVGHLSSTLVHPREVFKPALECSANSVIVVHNHPSGDPEPSDNDNKITLKLKRSGDVLNVPVTDHVIVAENGFYSFSEKMRL